MSLYIFFIFIKKRFLTFRILYLLAGRGGGFGGPGGGFGGSGGGFGGQGGGFGGDSGSNQYLPPRNSYRK